MKTVVVNDEDWTLEPEGEETSSDEGVKIAAENAAEVRDVTDMTPTASGALQPEAQSAFDRLKVALREYCFIKNTFLDEVEELQELETVSALRRNLNLVPVAPRTTLAVRGVTPAPLTMSSAKRLLRTLCASCAT